MAAFASGFESAGSIEERRELKRKAREDVLIKAKKQYEEDERREEQRKARGEDTWMLPDIEQRLQQINQESSVKGKKKRKKEKSKKKKKEKKKKIKKEQNQDSPSSESSADSDEWVEAPPSTRSADKAWKATDQAEPSSSSTNSSQRDEWMTFDFLAMKTTSVAEQREQKDAKKAAEQEKAKRLEQAGLHKLELNPYWKDGGNGLPPEQGESTTVVKACVVDDGGTGWLMKSYQRMKEQAEREKRSLENVVAERFGSMEQFQKRLQDAENASLTQMPGDKRIDRRRKQTDRERDRGWDRSLSPKASLRETDRQRFKGRDRWTESNRGQDGSDRERDEKRDRERDEKQDRERDEKRNKRRFLKPSDSDDFPALGADFRRAELTASSSSQLSKGFLKPGADDLSSWRKRDEKVETRTETKEEVSTQQRVETSSESEDEEEKEEEVRLLTDEEMNKLGAKLVKAELMGNTVMVDSLKAQLEAARKAKENQKHKPKQISAEAEQEVIMFRTDQSGQSWPVTGPAQHVEPRGGRKKRKPVETHVAGERVRYFADDDNMNLKEMVRREKMSSAQDQNSLYSRMAGRMMGKQDGDNYTLDDMFVSSVAQRERAGLDDERGRNRAMVEGRSLAAQLDKCSFCFSSSELPKHLVVAIGAKVYLCLPNSVSLTEGHCLIAPLQHHCCSTNLDEDVWNEIQMFRRSLVQMFESQGLDCVFLEMHRTPRKRMHMLYECVPLPRELGDMAPIYFKKAIMECDEEWAMNKKLVNLSSKNVRQAVPRGLPYFSVDFGLQGGFAHVIENQDKFPHYFGKEVLGGMLDLEPRRWRKPIRENFDDQRKKVLQFSQWWKTFDCTKSDS